MWRAVKGTVEGWMDKDLREEDAEGRELQRNKISSGMEDSYCL